MNFKYIKNITKLDIDDVTGVYVIEFGRGRGLAQKKHRYQLNFSRS